MPGGPNGYVPHPIEVTLGLRPRIRSAAFVIETSAKLGGSVLELETARIFVRLIEGYLGLGLILGLLIVFIPSLGARVDRGLAGAGAGFQLLVLPGCALLWPWLVSRLIRGGGEAPSERNAHRRASERS